MRWGSEVNIRGDELAIVEAGLFGVDVDVDVGLTLLIPLTLTLSVMMTVNLKLPFKHIRLGKKSSLCLPEVQCKEVISGLQS